MVIIRDLLNLVMDTQVLVTITEVPREFKDMVMDITRGLLLLVIMVMDMVELVTITEVPRESKDMVTDITRGLLLLVIMVMDMDLLMYMLNRRTMDMDIQSPMSMDTTSIKDQLMLDMDMVVIATNMLTDPTMITRSKFTTLTKCQIEIVPQLFRYINESKSTFKKK